jgi:hypothetical protein
VVGVEGFSLRAAVGEDDGVVLGEVGDDFREGAHVAAVAVDHEERRAGAIDLGVHLEAVDVVELADGGIVVVGDLCAGEGGCGEGGGEDEGGEGFHW